MYYVLSIQLLLPLKSTFQPRISRKEFDEARTQLLCASSFLVSFYSDPKPHRPKYKCVSSCCFGNEDNHSLQESHDRSYFKKGRVLIRKQNARNSEDKAIYDPLNIYLVIEVFTLKTFLMYRACVSVRDIVEIRTDLSKAYMRKPNPLKVATLFSSKTCIEMEFDTSSQRDKFAQCCRTMSAYFQMSARIFESE